MRCTNAAEDAQCTELFYCASGEHFSCTLLHQVYLCACAAVLHNANVSAGAALGPGKAPGSAHLRPFAVSPLFSA